MSDSDMPDAATLLFFNGHEKALPLYAAFEKKLMAGFPEARKRVQKTQITFLNRHVFACFLCTGEKKGGASGPVYHGDAGTAWPA